MKVIILKEVPKHELNNSAKNKRENITFQTNTLEKVVDATALLQKDV